MASDIPEIWGMLFFGGLLGLMAIPSSLSTSGPVSCRLTFGFLTVSTSIYFAALIILSIGSFYLHSFPTTTTRLLLALSSRQAQQRLASTLASVQVLISVVSMTYFSKWHGRSQVLPTERFVEMSCLFWNSGLNVSVAYNLTLVILCAILSCLSGNLPSGAHMTKHISLCISANLVVCICFLPAFLVASHERVRIVILISGVMANHVTGFLLLLMVPLLEIHFAYRKWLLSTVQAQTHEQISNPGKVGPLATKGVSFGKAIKKNISEETFSIISKDTRNI